jgi:hypothetical protein
VFGFVAYDVASSIRGLRDSVEQLNTRLAVVLERIEQHEKRIDKLEDSEQLRYDPHRFPPARQ